MAEHVRLELNSSPRLTREQREVLERALDDQEWAKLSVEQGRWCKRVNGITDVSAVVHAELQVAAQLAQVPILSGHVSWDGYDEPLRVYCANVQAFA